MEQQLEPKLPKRSSWVNQDEDEYEKVGLGLLTRHPINGIGAAVTTCGELTPSPVAAPTSGTTSDYSIHEEEEEDEEDESIV
ncbi:hypothetical protein F3Y22_tig00111427pilonHSYRG00120 [Hibiscus syriacus]|uniref:Uncharacterized protein n=1 Tax=Hibiscus syriacus TaxID=106335 RepID=A0A6A2XRP1_HIBSY|nr:hypothetical protein F3Y22_tig00111427pilonHSYRG00120 [Hibiscus syriacus]